MGAYVCIYDVDDGNITNTVICKYIYNLYIYILYIYNYIYYIAD